MFKASAPNPYEELVAKTTDENLTSENWELILNICDKVQEEGEAGARNVIAAVLKRLTHRNPNVQLYALALTEALSKNCGQQVNREVASRSFTQGLERIVTDRTTHDKVKRKALSLIYMWTAEFESDPSLGIMEECYENLRSKGYKFEEPNEPPPPQVDDEIRRREEEELQRALEMSVHDKGGRSAWQDAYGAGSSSSAGPSTSAYNTGSNRPIDAPPSGAASRYSVNDYGYAKTTTGYVPARTPSPKAQSPVIPSPATALPSYAAASAGSTLVKSSSQTSLPLTSVSRVRALHNFEGTEQGELTFEKGDIIKVVDRNYKDWWRGQLKGRTGIFPVNYVELLPDPTPEEIAREAEQEAAIFAQAANIDKLLSMLRGLDPTKDSLADNEEIQELYRQSMSLRPKIVKLIDKYSQKRAELVSMNETFVKARTMFDRMMEESLARHSGLYDGRPAFQTATPRPYVAPYEQGFTPFPQPAPSYPPATPTPASQPYGAPGYPTQQPPYGPYPAQQVVSPYGAQHPQVPPDGASPYGPYQQPTGQPQPGAQQQVPGTPQVYSQPQQAQQAQVQPMSPQSQQQQQQQQQQIPGPSPAAGQTQTQPNGYQDASAIPQVQNQNQTQPQAQGQTSNVITQGPPYVFDPNATYPDPNAQAWAQYYAAGGDDPTGAVYFISVPGVTDRQPQQSAPSQPSQQQQQPQPERRVSGGGPADVQQARPQGSPTADRASFYQAYPGQQSSSGYTAGQQQGVPNMTNGSAASLDSAHTQGPVQAQLQRQTSFGAPQSYQSQSQSQPAGGSPTASNASHGGGSFYSVAAQQQQPLPSQPQPSSPGASGITQPSQQAYPPNPYPDSTVSSQPAGPASSPHIPTQPGYDINAQFAQMHGQFGAMGMHGEPRSPGASAVTPAAMQTA
ncbi:hypothetical protein ACEPAG_4550 [Sanghuangporus baumii]